MFVSVCITGIGDHQIKTLGPKTFMILAETKAGRKDTKVFLLSNEDFILNWQVDSVLDWKKYILLNTIPQIYSVVTHTEMHTHDICSSELILF